MNISDLSKDSYDLIKKSRVKLNDLNIEHARLSHIMSANACDPIYDDKNEEKVGDGIFRYAGGNVNQKHFCGFCKNITNIRCDNYHQSIIKLNIMPAYMIISCKSCYDALYSIVC